MNIRQFGLALVVAMLALPGHAADEPAPATPKEKRTLGVVLFQGFELLDAMGPLEMFGNVGPQLKIVTVAEEAGEVTSNQRVKSVADYSFADCPPLDIILVPGGFGAMRMTNNEPFKTWLRDTSAKAELTLSVCNGAQLLAAAGILDGRRATTNKAFYTQIVNAGPKVNWVKEARWVDDGNIVTSSGVSAGIDMALHVIGRLYGMESAEKIAQLTEYQWHRNADEDPFAQFVK